MRLSSAALIASTTLIAGLVAPASAQDVPLCFGRRPTITGTDGEDVLHGTKGPDVIFGGRGTDVIRGRGGNDRICGGSGENKVYGNEGNDRLDGGKSTRASTVAGGMGNDLLYDEPGGFHAQNMFGGPGSDVLKAGDNNGTYLDYLDGGPGDDTIEHGEGPGVFVAHPDDGDDVMRGGGPHRLSFEGDQDILDLRDSGGPMEVDMVSGTVTGAGSDALENVEVVLGGDYADVIRGDAARNYVLGGGGDDTLEGRGGRDCLLGAGENDDWTRCSNPFEVEPDSGDDALDGGSGADLLGGADGNDTIAGGAGTDTVLFTGAPGPVTVDLSAETAAGDGADSVVEVETVVGSSFADSLTGTEGPDFLDPYQSRGDVLRGLGGDDTLGMTRSIDADGGEGSDTASYAGARSVSTIDLREDSDSLDNSLQSIENTVLGPNGDATIHGDEGVNRLEGGSSRDEIYAYGGDDTLLGVAGNDFLDGGDGDDTLDGGDNGEGGDTCVNGERVANCED